MVVSSAVSPAYVSGTAILVRDIVSALNSYDQKRLKINKVLDDLKLDVKQKKSCFDNRWHQKFSDEPEYWPLELIIENFKVSSV
jgi:hypothetical protein